MYNHNINEVEIIVSGECDDLDLEKAIPLAIMFNELATNSFKYAFLNIEKPAINVHISQKQNVCLITYTDNGIGLQNEFTKDSGGFGFKVLHILAKQIKSLISYHRLNNNSEFRIEMPLDNKNKTYE
jgi:two-component sensor histidine kinase